MAAASKEAELREASREAGSPQKRHLATGTPKLVVLSQGHSCPPGNARQCVETLLVVTVRGGDAVGFY